MHLIAHLHFCAVSHLPRCSARSPSCLPPVTTISLPGREPGARLTGSSSRGQLAHLSGAVPAGRCGQSPRPSPANHRAKQQDRCMRPPVKHYRCIPCRLHSTYRLYPMGGIIQMVDVYQRYTALLFYFYIILHSITGTGV